MRKSSPSIAFEHTMNNKKRSGPCCFVPVKDLCQSRRIVCSGSHVRQQVHGDRLFTAAGHWLGFTWRKLRGWDITIRHGRRSPGACFSEMIITPRNLCASLLALALALKRQNKKHRMMTRSVWKCSFSFMQSHQLPRQTILVSMKVLEFLSRYICASFKNSTCFPAQDTTPSPVILSFCLLQVLERAINFLTSRGFPYKNRQKLFRNLRVFFPLCNKWTLLTVNFVNWGSGWMQEEMNMSYASPFGFVSSSGCWWNHAIREN